MTLVHTSHITKEYLQSILNDSAGADKNKTGLGSAFGRLSSTSCDPEAWGAYGTITPEVEDSTELQTWTSTPILSPTRTLLAPSSHIPRTMAASPQ